MGNWELTVEGEEADLGVMRRKFGNKFGKMNFMGGEVGSEGRSK
jgi:hypothetical protein